MCIQGKTISQDMKNERQRKENEPAEERTLAIKITL